MMNKLIHILLIEDDLDDVLLLKETLAESTAQRFQITHAGRLDTGLDYLAVETFDVILLDLNLPDSQGLDTLKTLLQRTLLMPIVVMSGLADEALALEAVQQGAHDYLVKGSVDGQMMGRILRYTIERQGLYRDLQISETRTHAIIESNIDGILIVDGEGVVRFANGVTGTIFGRPVKKLVGEPFDFSVTMDKASELEIFRLDGNASLVEMRATDIDWDGHLAYLISLRDITQQRETEEILHESELLKKAIFESSLDSIVTIDHETEIIEFNPSAEKMFGYTRDEAIGKQATDLIISIIGGEVYGEGFVRHLLSDRGAAINKRIDGVGKRADGSEFPIEVSVTRLQLDHPIFTAYIRDITERKQIEKAEQELVQMKNEFVANVSHQLRTPIFSIRGFLELLLKGKVKEETVQQEFLGRAYAESDRLMLLVNNLLDMSQLENGLLRLDTKELVLNSLIDEVLKSLQQLADDKEISLIHTPPESQVRIKADPRWLSEALVNLVGNAIKFSQPGLPIRVAELVRDGRVLVKVIDQGPGIPDEALPKLFSKFYQVSGQAERTGSSSGMGLYIAKGIVEEHGGRIGVKSKLGQGSVFYFTLPVLG